MSSTANEEARVCIFKKCYTHSHSHTSTPTFLDMVFKIVIGSKSNNNKFNSILKLMLGSTKIQVCVALFLHLYKLLSICLSHEESSYSHVRLNTRSNSILKKSYFYFVTILKC
jgi:translation initiation factor 2 beta subunit (eIF-2beta)/eIF-5